MILEAPLTKREIATRERRRFILETAIACFAEKGFHQTGMRDIAKRAEVSLGNLYNHFSGKHDMLVGLAEWEAEAFAQFAILLSRDTPTQQVLKAFIHQYYDYASEQNAAILNLEIVAEAMRHPDIADLFLKSRNTLASSLAALITRGIQVGLYKPATSTEEAAKFILDLIENAAGRNIIDRGNPNHEKRQLETFVLCALNHQSE